MAVVAVVAVAVIVSVAVILSVVVIVLLVVIAIYSFCLVVIVATYIGWLQSDTLVMYALEPEWFMLCSCMCEFGGFVWM